MQYTISKKELDGLYAQLNAASIELVVFDIETVPVKSWHFSCGKQVLRHANLDPEHNCHDIISISWVSSKDRKPHVLHWGLGSETSQEMVKKFDNVIRAAQDRGAVLIGKNNNRFDNKHLNTLRWLYSHEQMPDWIKYIDDLERQMRRYFYMQSFSLDYASYLRGLGGKDKMQFSDWTNIVERKSACRYIADIEAKYDLDGVTAYELVACLSLRMFNKTLAQVMSDGKIALVKMCDYNKKDCLDTLDLFVDMSRHFEWKNKLIRTRPEKPKLKTTNHLTCPLCSKCRLTLNGTRGDRQLLFCTTFYKHAGTVIIKKDGRLGNAIV